MRRFVLFESQTMTRQETMRRMLCYLYEPMRCSLVILYDLLNDWLRKSKYPSIFVLRLETSTKKDI